MEEGLLAYKGLRINASRGQCGLGSSLSFKKKDILLKEAILVINLLLQVRMSDSSLRWWRFCGSLRGYCHNLLRGGMERANLV